MASWIAEFKEVEENHVYFGVKAVPGSTRPGAPTPPGSSRREVPEDNRLKGKLLNPKTPQDLAEANKLVQQIIRK
jgi:hypothetical protein